MKQLLQSTLQRRLEDQEAALLRILEDVRDEHWRWNPTPTVWSAYEHWVHIGRFQEVFIERITRILKAPGSWTIPYDPADDEILKEWHALDTAAARTRFSDTRRELSELCRRITVEELEREGVHPSYGRISIGGWIDFFFMHEAHHCYIILARVRAAKLRQRGLA